MTKAKTLARNPTIPRSKTNPVGQTKRIARVKSAAFADIAKAQKLAIETLESWPVEVRNAFTTNAFYEFQIDTFQLERLIDAITDTLKQGGGPEEARRAAEAAYREGVAKTTANLAGLTDLITQSVTERLADQQTLRRAVLAGSRAFEQMQGFADQTATDLARVLFEAVQSGENPRQTAKTIRERFSVSKARAERIARTETTMALRRGRWDEAREQEQKLGMEVRLLHNSALIFGRTRISHARRHGKIVTVEEEAAWYAQDGNAINCLCSQTEIVVGPDGEPLFGQELVKRMETERAKFLGTSAPAAPKPKDDPRADSLKRLKKDQPLFSGAQDGSMNSATLLALQAAEKAGDLREIVDSDGAWCDFSGRLSMGTHVLGTEAYRRVFRHEYGHYIDDAIAKSGIWAKGAQRPIFSSFRAVDALVEDTKKLEEARSSIFMREKLGSLAKRRIAESRRAQVARSNELLDELIDHPSGTKEGWLDEFFAPFGVKSKDVTALFGGEPKDFTSVELARLAAAWERKDVGELLFWFPKERGVKIDHSTAFAGLQDTFEAGTGGNSRIQFGHGKKYYTDGTEGLKGLGLTKTLGLRTYNGYNTGQAFANWFEAYGDSNPATAAMYRHLWPNVFEAFEELLREFVEAR